MNKALWPLGFGCPALGSYLHEYTYDELRQLYLDCGFAKVDRGRGGHRVLVVATR